MKVIICVILKGPNKWAELESTEYITRIQKKIIIIIIIIIVDVPSPLQKI